MHDALHRKQLEHLKRLKSLCSQFPRNGSAREVGMKLVEWQLGSQTFLDVARRESVQMLLGPGFENEIREVEKSLASASTNTRISDLEDCVDLLDRVLGQTMPRVDGAIAQAIHDLDLSEVAVNAGLLRPSGAGPSLSREQVQGLQRSLDQRVRNHGIWQMIDDDLRRCNQALAAPNGTQPEVGASWLRRHQIHYDRLFRKIDHVVAEAADEADRIWAQPLRDARNRLAEALPTCELELMRNEYLTVETICDLRFNRADDDLLRTCNEVNELREQIDNLLRGDR